MSYAGGVDDYSFVGATSWAQINHEGNAMIAQCMLHPGLHSGGAVVVHSSEHSSKNIFPCWFLIDLSALDRAKAAVNLFMWESGSTFDFIMNSFTNGPAPMIPAPGNGFISNWTSANISEVTQV